MAMLPIVAAPCPDYSGTGLTVYYSSPWDELESSVGSAGALYIEHLQIT